MTRNLKRILLTLLVLVITSASADAATYYVRASGNDSNSGTSSSSAWRSITKVTQQTLSLGDVVYVGAGTYDGTFVFSRMNNSSSGSGSSGSSNNGNSGSGNNGNGNGNSGSNAGGNSNGNGNSGNSNAGGNSGSGNNGNGNGNGGSNSSLIQLIADTNGTYTGDRGPVILRGGSNAYAMQLDTIDNWLINGFTFQSQNTSSRSYGIYILRGATNIAISSCTFDTLISGINSYSTAATGSYATNTVTVSNSTFSNGTSWDILNYNYSSLTVSGCNFQHTSGQTGGIYNAIQSDAVVSNSVFSSGYYGIYGADAGDLSVTSTTFSSVSYPLYGSSDTTTITSCTTTGAVYGCYMNCDVTPITVSNCSFTGGTYGMLVPQYSASISNLTLTSNVIGLWIDARVPSLTVNSSLNLQFAGNQYGIYVEYRADGSRPNITVESLRLEDCTAAGIMAYTGDLTVRNCQFNRVANSVYVHANARSMSVRNCSFASATSGWAIYSGCLSNVVRDCSFTNCTYGIQLYPNTMSTPDISNLSFTNGTYAVLGYNLDIDISRTTNVTFNGAYLGWYLINSDVSFNNASISGASYPVYTSGGTLSLVDTQVSGGVYNVYANGFSRCTLTRTTIQNATTWGAYLSGQNVSLSDTSISRNVNGLYVQDTNETTRSQVSNLTCEYNTNWGALWASSDFALSPNQQSYFRNNYYGLGSYYRNVNLTSTSGMTISNNTVGLYVNRGDVSLDGVTLNDNFYGMQQYYGALTCANSAISGGYCGIYHISGPSVNVSRTTFVRCTGYGVIVSNSDATIVSQPVVVTDSTFTGNGTGLYAYVRPDARVSLERSSISGGAGYGALFYNAPTTLSNLSISGNRSYGVLAYDANLTLSDSTISSNGSYGVYLSASSAPERAVLTARRNRFSRNAYGIGCYRVASGELSNNVIHGSTYGVVSHVNTGTLEVWNNTLVDSYIGVYHYGGSARVKNNIISYGDMNATRTSSYGFYRINNAPMDIGTNLVFGQTSKYYGITRGPGDVIKPPRFVDRANGNFELQNGSPAINAGTDATAIVATDIAMNARPAYRGYEIGAYEYTGRSGSVRVLDWKEAAQRSR